MFSGIHCDGFFFKNFEEMMDTNMEMVISYLCERMQTLWTPYNNWTLNYIGYGFEPINPFAIRNNGS